MKESDAREITRSAQEKYSKEVAGLTQTSRSHDSSSQPSYPVAFRIATDATFKKIYAIQEGDDRYPSRVLALNVIFF